MYDRRAKIGDWQCLDDGPEKKNHPELRLAVI
jgi:hypothetical protein